LIAFQGVIEDNISSLFMLKVLVQISFLFLFTTSKSTNIPFEGPTEVAVQVFALKT
jgi:hypothetical protein